MRLGLAGLGVALVSLWSLPCLASAPQKNAISYEPLAILSRGMVLQYERLVAPPFSVVGGAGVRWAARDDFWSQTLLLKLEARLWLREPMRGPYFGFGTSTARTELENRRYDRSLGAIWQLQESARFGYRFVLFDFQELTPSVGLNVIHDFDENGRLAPSTVVSLGANFSVGWLF